MCSLAWRLPCSCLPHLPCIPASARMCHMGTQGSAKAIPATGSPAARLEACKGSFAASMLTKTSSGPACSACRPALASATSPPAPPAAAPCTPWSTPSPALVRQRLPAQARCRPATQFSGPAPAAGGCCGSAAGLEGTCQGRHSVVLLSAYQRRAASNARSKCKPLRSAHSAACARKTLTGDIFRPPL